MRKFLSSKFLKLAVKMDDYCGTLLRYENLDFLFQFLFWWEGSVVDTLFCQRIKYRRSWLTEIPILALSCQLNFLWSLYRPFKKRATGERTYCPCGIKTEYFDLKEYNLKLRVHFATIYWRNSDNILSKLPLQIVFFPGIWYLWF